MKQICKQCGKEFELTDGEIKFYKDKGLTLPKRCADCREANKSDNKTDKKKSPKGRLGAIAAAVAVTVGIVAGNSAVSSNGPTGDGSAGADSSAYFQLSDEARDDNAENLYQSTDEDIISDDRADVRQDEAAEEAPYVQEYYFKTQKTRDSHFEKHGGEFGGQYATAEEYETGADKVAHSTDALHKTEKEDGDDVYYIEDSNEFVIVSPDGYIRTYFKPSAGKKYYDRQ